MSCNKNWRIKEPLERRDRLVKTKAVTSLVRLRGRGSPVVHARRNESWLGPLTFMMYRSLHWNVKEQFVVLSFLRFLLSWLKSDFMWVMSLRMYPRTIVQQESADIGSSPAQPLGSDSQLSPLHVSVVHDSKLASVVVDAILVRLLQRRWSSTGVAVFVTYSVHSSHRSRILIVDRRPNSTASAAVWVEDQDERWFLSLREDSARDTNSCDVTVIKQNVGVTMWRQRAAIVRSAHQVSALTWQVLHVKCCWCKYFPTESSNCVLHVFAIWSNVATDTDIIAMACCLFLRQFWDNFHLWVSRLDKGGLDLIQELSQFLDVPRIRWNIGEITSQLKATLQVFVVVSRSMMWAIFHASVLREFRHEDLHVISDWTTCEKQLLWCSATESRYFLALLQMRHG